MTRSRAEPDLAAVEARLRAILDGYRDRLEPNTLYGVETLRRPGAIAHDFFVGIRTGPKHVGWSLKPIYTHPELLDTISLALRKRLQGASTFGFSAVDDGLFAELEDLTARSFERYEQDGAVARSR